MLRRTFSCWNVAFQTALVGVTVKGCGFSWEVVADRVLAKIDTVAVDSQPLSLAAEKNAAPDFDKSQQEASRPSSDVAQALPSSQQQPSVSQGPAHLTLAARACSGQAWLYRLMWFRQSRAS